MAKLTALALLVTLSCSVMGCGGGNGIDRPAPAPAAPRDVIAFGAVDATGEHALYLVGPDGTGLQTLTTDNRSVSFPRWSPDGDRIAYVAGGGRGPDTKAGLRIYDFDGGITTTVSEFLLASGDEAPMAWSPEGARIAFIDAANGGTLRIYDFAAGELVSTPPAGATSVAWSARDELAIVAPADGGASTDVYTLRPGEAQPRLTEKLAGTEGALAWSPDGRMLAFWRDEAGELAQRDLLLRNGGVDDVGPGTDAAWSAGGALAYAGSAVKGDRGGFDVYLRNDGGAIAPLAQSITLDRWPSWSPAGDAIAYLGVADATTSFLCVIEVETRNNDCFDLPGLTPSAPAWSPF